MQQDNYKLADTIFEKGKKLVAEKGKHSINKYLFPPCSYTERKELVEGQGKVFVTDNERRIADMDERGHIFFPANGKAKLVINRNLPILNSIKTVAELTQSQEMLEKYGLCIGICNQIVIDKIAEVISSGKVSFSKELFETEILLAWRKCEEEEKEVNVELDKQTSILCKDVFENYVLGYKAIKNNCETESALKQFEKLITPEEIQAKAMENDLTEESSANDEIAPEA